VVGAIDCSPNALPPTQSRNRADFLIWVSRNRACCRVFRVVAIEVGMSLVRISRRHRYLRRDGALSPPQV
jgi:hypothetical protein